MIISDFSFDSSSSLGCLLPDVKAAAGYLPECQKGKKPGNEVVFNLSPECNGILFLKTSLRIALAQCF